jgi:putative Holliday junction resolvase
MPRFLGIDFGTKHIGLAVGDTDTGIASPAGTIRPQGGEAERVRAVLNAAQDFEIDAFVLGLPVHMDDTEGEQAKVTRRFGDALAKATGKAVFYWDERLSSRAARALLQPSGLTRRKKKNVEDSVAAQVILQEFLDAGDARSEGA